MKNKFKRLFYFILFVVTAFKSFAQVTDNINPDVLNKTWQARWITCPGISGSEYGVYLFRKTAIIEKEAKEFIIHVSADNRYKLYVNEKYICNGPARGDLLKWYFESINIAPHLKEGKNIITAVVWNFAEYRPFAQFSFQTGFIIQGNTAIESVFNTDKSWNVFKDSAYSPLPVNIDQYYVAGPGEKLISEIHPWNWMKADFDDSNWEKAKELEPGSPLQSHREWGAPAGHVLQPREIPLMEEKYQRFSQIRRSGLSNIPAQFLNGEKTIIVPANSNIKILLDQNSLTNAYPVLTFSNGRNSRVKLTYSESLFNDKKEKGNRNEIDNKKIIGNQDIIIADGGENRTFQTLWWRTFRYVEMEIQTKDEPLTINDFYSIFTGYPFKEKATFKCSDSTFTDIWNTGWHTQRLCAGETFFDCPYYEQLQYIGDTRIQCLVSSYVTGDFTLMKNAIAAIHDSRFTFGLTQSRYPSYQTQIVPTFSLIWTTMVYDYWMLRDDKQFVEPMIPEIMDVMNWYIQRIDSTGMLGKMEWWNFVDWVRNKNWEAGTPPGLYNSHSSVINLQFVYTLQKAAVLLNAFNFKEQASKYLQLAENIKAAVYKSCYDKQKGLIADSPEKINYSQHANVLAILTNTIPTGSQIEVMNKIMNEKDLAQCSYYFQFYLTEALEQANLSDRYPDMLSPWEQMLGLGLTTFAEEPDPTRSDCHAWSASPVYYFLSLICGIKPNEPGFRSVRIEPHPGRLKWIEGSIPYQSGTIKVNLKKGDDNNLTGDIILPENLTGIFIWNEKSKSLKGGINSIQIK